MASATLVHEGDSSYLQLENVVHKRFPHAVFCYTLFCT